MLRLDALRLDVARLEKIGAEAGQDRADHTREKPVPVEEAAEKTAAIETAGTKLEKLRYWGLLLASERASVRAFMRACVHARRFRSPASRLMVLEHLQSSDDPHLNEVPI